MNASNWTALEYARQVSHNVDREAVRPFLEAHCSGERDFEAGDYRFIHSADIDEIMLEELEGDEYVLGCASPWFLADILGAPVEVIEKMQAAEAFEALGLWILDGHLKEFQEGVVRHDGYGAHFGHYDGNEWELGDYYYFRIN